LAVGIESPWYKRNFEVVGVTKDPIGKLEQVVDGQRVNIVQLYATNKVVLR